MPESAAATVREFRHILLWPLQLRRLRRETGYASYWDVLRANPGPWKEVKDNLLVEDESAQSSYQEFVYFLPYVQRFLYGFGEADAQTPSSLHMFRRDDIATARVRLQADAAPVDLEVARTRLVFFYDQDVAILAFEVVARDLPLEHAIELMDRFGRPYPPYWESPGQGAHCVHSVEFRDAGGALLSTSDYGDRDKYVGLVRDIKQTPLSLHWEYLLHPMVPAYLGGGLLQYYQIENKRIPIMTYLAFDDPRALTRGDLARIGFAAKWGPSETQPFAPRFLADFEQKYCYDRYWDAGTGAGGMNTRFVFCGVAFAMITKHEDERTDLVHTFRRQFYQIGLIANFHKAALLNLSNRFSIAVERLRVGDYASVRVFKDSVREALELFLRFNHRYWFHEISNQVLATDIFRRWAHQLGSDALFAEVREEAQDINQYLDADRTRKFGDNAMRLTVVSALGMAGTVVTGFLGMNLFSHADRTGWDKFWIFIVVFVPTVLLGLYTVVLSKRIATFFEALSSERLTWRQKFGAFRQIWRPPPRAPKVRKRVAGGDEPTRRSAGQPPSQRAPSGPQA
jgi:hypothetical protein